MGLVKNSDSVVGEILNKPWTWFLGRTPQSVVLYGPSLCPLRSWKLKDFYSQKFLRPGLQFLLAMHFLPKQQADTFLICLLLFNCTCQGLNPGCMLLSFCNIYIHDLLMSWTFLFYPQAPSYLLIRKFHWLVFIPTPTLILRSFLPWHKSWDSLTA